MIKVYAVCVSFRVEDIDTQKLTVIERYEFEQWIQNDKNIYDQKTIDELERMYNDWLKNQQSPKELSND